MPFKSQQQRKFMFAKHPKIAKRWSEKYKTPKHLPKKVDKGFFGHTTTQTLF